MKRLTILGIFVIVAMMFTAPAVIAGPTGPKDGLDVRIVNPLPVPVTGSIDVNVVNECLHQPKIWEDCDIAGGQPVINQTDGSRYFVLETYSVRLILHENDMLYNVRLKVGELDDLLYTPVNCTEGFVGTDAVQYCTATVNVRAVVDGSMQLLYDREYTPGDTLTPQAYLTVCGYLVNKTCKQP